MSVAPWCPSRSSKTPCCRATLRVPEDEQVNIRLRGLPYFEELPGMPQQFNVEELPVDVSEPAPSIPEPGALMLVGLGLLGVSHRLRRTFHPR